MRLWGRLEKNRLRKYFWKKDKITLKAYRENCGYNVEKEYFDQQIEFLSEDNTIYEEYSQTFPSEEPLQIRKNLGTFMFSGEDVFKKINILSGGEKVRLQFRPFDCALHARSMQIL